MQNSKTQRDSQKMHVKSENTVSTDLSTGSENLKLNKELFSILSEFKELSGRLSAVISEPGNNSPYDKSLKTINEEIDYITEGLTPDIEGEEARLNSPEIDANRTAPILSAEKEEKAEDSDRELKRANTLLIKEVLERRCIEIELKKSLNEKDVLYKEIHHRVKNNLQIVSSLLNLQSQKIQDFEARECFNESKNRIRSIATLHEQLYRSKELSRIDFSTYLHELTNYLLHSYGAGNGYINVVLDTERIYLDLSTAIPCGLIVNELLSNAITHGFPKLGNDGSRGKGEIRIEFKVLRDKYVLSIRNNGKEFPKEVDIYNSGTLGLELVYALSKQLRGTIELVSNEMTEFRLEFEL